MSGDDSTKDTTSMLQAAWMADLRRQEKGSDSDVATSSREAPPEPPKEGSIPAYIKQLDQALNANQTAKASALPTTTAQPWFKHAVFLQAMACLVVFLATFVLVIIIRPPFLNKRKIDDDPMTVPKFSPLNALYMALATTGVALVSMVIIALVQKTKKTSGLAKARAVEPPPKTTFFPFNRTQSAGP